MPYSIISPILVVLSVIGIILILMKKAPEIGRLDALKENEKDKVKNGEKKNYFTKTAVNQAEKKSWLKKNISLIFLALLGIIKILFLSPKKFFNKWREYSRKRKADREAEKENFFKKNIVSKISNEEKVIRPFISDKIVQPNIDEDKRKEIKERLEELLINRIASNPKDFEAYEKLGEYYMETGNLEHSKECFKQVMRLDSSNRSVLYKIRKLERMLKK